MGNSDSTHSFGRDDSGKACAAARRGQMDLLYADALLQRAACYLDVWPTMTSPERSLIRGKIKDTLAESANLVTAFGYARRQKMLAELHEAAGAAGALA